MTMGKRQYCGAPTNYRWRGRPEPGRGYCQNSPMTGMLHCRHHLTPDERAIQRATIQAAYDHMPNPHWKGTLDA